MKQTDPLGLTPEQRAYSDASRVIDKRTPAWWTREYREGIIHARIMTEMRR